MAVDEGLHQEDPTDASDDRVRETTDVPIDRLKHLARNMFRKEFTDIAHRIEQLVLNEVHESLDLYFGRYLTVHEEVPPQTEDLMEIITKLGQHSFSDGPSPKHMGSPRLRPSGAPRTPAGQAHADAVHFSLPLLGPSADRRPSLVPAEADLTHGEHVHADATHFPLPWFGASAKMDSEISDSASAPDPDFMRGVSEFMRATSQGAVSVSPLDTLQEPLFAETRNSKQTFGDKLRRGRKLYKHHLAGDIAVGLMHIAESRRLAYGVALAIVLNALFIGLQTHDAAVNCTVRTPTIFYVSEAVFCVIFVLEIVLRIAAYRCSFFCGPEWQWNCFDFLVVAMQVVEQLMYMCYYLKGGGDILRLSESTSTFTVLRIFRLCRVFRLARVVHIVSDLQGLLASIVSSLRALCWTLVLLAIISYMLGIVLTQIVTEHRVALHSPHEEALREHFGSLTSSMLSLFESITDGIEWADVVNPLREDISPLLLFPFCFYISFVSFALLNVITAIFIDRSLQHGQDELRKYLLEEARLVFMSKANGEKSHMITWPEMETHLKDPHLKSLLHAIDVDESHAHELFNLIDDDDVGEIEVTDFVNGCLQVSGLAKAIDLAALVHENRRVNKKFVEHAEFVNQCLISNLKIVWGIKQRLGPGDASREPSKGNKAEIPPALTDVVMKTGVFTL